MARHQARATETILFFSPTRTIHSKHVRQNQVLPILEAEISTLEKGQVVQGLQVPVVETTSPEQIPSKPDKGIRGQGRRKSRTSSRAYKANIEED